MHRGHKWLLAGTMALSAGAFFGVTGAGSAVGAASPATHPVVGSYEVTVAWTNPVIDTTYPIVLNANHTVTYPTTSDTGTWSKAGKKITIVVDGGVATYHGKVTGYGLSKPSKPGTMANTSGNSGTWYAAYQSPSAPHGHASSAAVTGR